MKVIKRDGRVVEFDKQKIVNAIEKAFIEVEGGTKESIVAFAQYVADCVKETNKYSLNVEEIQDIVENTLWDCGYRDVAKAYVIYRNDRTRFRQANSKLSKKIADKLFAKTVENQNANVDEHSFGGRMGAMTSAVTKDYALNNCMSEMAKNNHLNNEIYIHDLDHYPIGDHNCLSVPFDKLLANGFYTRQTDVRPAQSVNTAFQLVAVIFQLQSLQQFGGVSATHLDWTMVPYVRKSFYKYFRDGLKWVDNSSEYVSTRFSKELSVDAPQYTTHQGKAYQYAMNMVEKEIYQAVEGLYHNLNTLQSRSGNQLPFTSINYGTCTKPEGRMVTKALLEVSIRGIGKLHKTPVFPCGIFQVMKGVNKEPGTPNYDLYRLALKSTSLRLYPNYANVDWSGNKGYDINDPRTYFSTMGCRTANGWDINGFGQLKDGRGNICPVTIILPTIAMKAKRTFDKQNERMEMHDEQKQLFEYFLRCLDTKIHEAKDMLIERFEWICSQSPKSARFMYENGLMEGYVPEEGIRSALKHGTLALGQLGLSEALQILIGKDQTTDEGMAFAKQVEQLFKERCAEFKEQYKLNFGVYFTPEHKIYCLRGLA